MLLTTSDPQVMSALGQKQTSALQNVMSALPPKADICSAQADVRLVPRADIRAAIASNGMTFVSPQQAPSVGQDETDRRSTV